MLFKSSLINLGAFNFDGLNTEYLPPCSFVCVLHLPFL